MIDSLKYYDGLLKIIRDMITSKAMSAEKRNETFKAMMRRHLCLNNENELDVILTALDVIEDANLAIIHFFKYELEGPTRYEDIGEKYLRLYGLLNAIYLHRDSIVALARMFKVKNYSSYAETINNLKIVEIRNKIGAHSVNYKHKDGIQCYVPIRISLAGTNIELHNVNCESDCYEAVDLKILVNEYLTKVFELTHQTVLSFVKLVFKTNKEKLNEMEAKASLIQQQISKEILVINDSLIIQYV